jgi:putative endonuclease
MASRRNGTLYLGVTSNLVQRAFQHRERLIDGFSKEHGCTTLVWYEEHDDLQEARRRELQLKKWKRAWKLDLIEQANPQWKDLYETLF